MEPYYQEVLISNGSLRYVLLGAAAPWPFKSAASYCKHSYSLFKWLVCRKVFRLNSGHVLDARVLKGMFSMLSIPSSPGHQRSKTAHSEDFRPIDAADD
jgi:hypothetical protein